MSVDVLIVILTALPSLLPLALLVAGALSSSPTPSLLHLCPVILPGDPGLMLPGDDTDKFCGERRDSVAGGGMDGTFGEEHGTDVGVDAAAAAEAIEMCCEGGESLICGGIPVTMPCGEIRKL